MEGGVERGDSGRVTVADHDGDAAVVEDDSFGVVDPHAKQTSEISAVNDVVGRDQTHLAGVLFQQIVKTGSRAVVDRCKRFAARVTVLRGVSVKALKTLWIEGANGLPVQSLPAADVALGQGVEWLR